jgi:aconitate hydratase
MEKGITFDPRGSLAVAGEDLIIYRIHSLPEQGMADVQRLPFSIRILLENLLRNAWVGRADEREVRELTAWRPGNKIAGTIPFSPARVVLQDFTGVPALVDLAAMRSALHRAGGDPSLVNPKVPADLVIDHSVQADRFGSADACEFNVKKEMERNGERYSLLRWGCEAFENFRVVPPGTGIVHQVNLEYLGTVVQAGMVAGEKTAFPDTLVGTDSHTPMINGLGILGWGVGGIEAEAILLGQPYVMPVPEVVGIKLTGRLPEGSTATDLVLHITERLRREVVVGKFVEFFGPGLSTITLPDRATISNMSPEYGATTTYFPVDGETLNYLAGTGRDEKLINLIELYTKEQGFYHESGMDEPEYSVVRELDLGGIEPTLAGPRKPHERVSLSGVKESFMSLLPDILTTEVNEDLGDYQECGIWAEEGGACQITPEVWNRPAEPRTECRCVDYHLDVEKTTLSDGSVVIAAITSCTNTSNPSVMIGAGLLAKKAVEKGLKSKPWVKTSLAPGSRVVTEYLQKAGLMPFLEALGFHVVGYGCTTCIGNSGPLHQSIAGVIEEHQLITAAVLSGNRNYEARINPLVRANYLASPVLVVAYAIAGSVATDLKQDPLAMDPNGKPVYLKDIWPTSGEIQESIDRSLDPGLFKKVYSQVFDGDAAWNSLPVPDAGYYSWDPGSSYIQEPPFFQDLPDDPPVPGDIEDARVLGIFGDTLTTDHISPAGSIPEDSPAGQYLISRGIQPADFNSFGSRRGNHEVLLRGTFGNIRIRNRMTGREGGWTVHQPGGELMTIYDAAMRYREEGIPLVVFGGREYGAGSSRDWAAKGTMLLGVRAVIVESFERIHRSNLVGMGVLPLCFEEGMKAVSLGLTGRERVDINGIGKGLTPGGYLTVKAHPEDGGEPLKFRVLTCLESRAETEYLKHGGILHKILRETLSGK